MLFTLLMTLFAVEMANESIDHLGYPIRLQQWILKEQPMLLMAGGRKVLISRAEKARIDALLAAGTGGPEIESILQKCEERCRVYETQVKATA